MTVVFPKLQLHSFIAFTKIILSLLKSFFFFFSEKNLDLNLPFIRCVTLGQVKSLSLYFSL